MPEKRSVREPSGYFRTKSSITKPSRSTLQACAMQQGNALQNGLVSSRDRRLIEDAIIILFGYRLSLKIVINNIIRAHGTRCNCPGNIVNSECTAKYHCISPIQRQALVPPKPNELDNAIRLLPLSTTNSSHLLGT